MTSRPRRLERYWDWDDRNNIETKMAQTTLRPRWLELHPLHLVPPWSKLDKENIISIYVLGSATLSPIYLAMLKERENYIFIYVLGSALLSPYRCLAWPYYIFTYVFGSTLLSPFVCSARHPLHFVTPSPICLAMLRKGKLFPYMCSARPYYLYICVRLDLIISICVLGSAPSPPCPTMVKERRKIISPHVCLVRNILQIYVLNYVRMMTISTQ